MQQHVKKLADKLAETTSAQKQLKAEQQKLFDSLQQVTKKVDLSVAELRYEISKKQDKAYK